MEDVPLSKGELKNESLNAISSTDCMPEAVCLPPAYSKELEAVALVIANGDRGSGIFLNNENQDRRPFLLTAHHVIDGDDDGTISPAEIAGVGTIAVTIDFRTTSCGGTVNTGTALLGGGILRSYWHATDFALVEMNIVPHIQEWVTYAGWNRTGSTPSSVVGIHHPRGEHMRFATSGGHSVRVFPLNWNFFEIVSWATGATAGGSSGSALFNENRQVVGQLAGGLSGCTFLLPDIYGRFYDSWEGAGTAGTQLKHWLSPTNNLSSMSLFDPLVFSNTNYFVCYGTNTTITLPHVLPGETATWGVTGGISIVSTTYNSVTVTATNPGTNGGASVTATFGTQSITKPVWYGKPSSVSGTMDGIPVSYPQPCSTASRLAVIGQGIQSCSWTVTDGSIAITPVPGATYMCDIGYFSDYVRIKAQPSNACGSGPDYTFYLIDPTMWFMAYPNPATNELTIQFSDISNAELLPKAVYLYHESSTIPKKQANVKEVYDKNGLLEGNKLIWDVSSLPRGIYYLHVIPSEKSDKKEIEKLRIILE